MSDETFIDLALAGKVHLDEVDDYAEAWHDGPNGGRSMDEFLGFVGLEGALWAEQACSLPFILEARRQGYPFDQAILDGDWVALTGRRLGMVAEALTLWQWMASTRRRTSVSSAAAM